MKLIKYGVILERLTESDIEMVRQHRNSETVTCVMNFRQYITKEMQLKWFHSIENDSNYYFVIIYEGKKIGLINIKDISLDRSINTSESGLFIWDMNYIDTPAPLLASLIVSEFGYGFLDGESTRVRILQTNRKAIDFNKNLGYIETGNVEDGFILFQQSRESFIQQTVKLRKKALVLCNKDPVMYLYVEPVDKITGMAQKFYNLVARRSQMLPMRKEGETEVYSLLFDFS